MSNAAIKVAPDHDPDEGWSLPAWVYGDAEFHDVEMARVMRPSWQVVCHVSDIASAGDWHTLEFLGESILVIRGGDDVVRAFTNVCRHRASRLVDGASGCAKKLVCPYHAWTYDLDGRLTGVPFRGQYDMRVEDHGLAPVDMEIWRGFVFVRLAPPRNGEGDHAQHGGGAGAPAPDGAAPPPSFGRSPSPNRGGLSVADMMAPYDAEIAPYRFEDLRAIGRVTLRPRHVNWKNVADNYSDGLHINVAHPGLTRLFGKGYAIEAERHVDKMSGTLVDRPSANASERMYQHILPRVDHLPEALQRHWVYYKLWPNVAFDIYPDQVDFMQFLPVSPTETLIREISYAIPDANESEQWRREMRAARFLNWRINRKVNAEDTTLIARVQAGMASSSYTVGPLGSSEVCLRSFARKLRRLIPEARLHQPPAKGWSEAG